MPTQTRIYLVKLYISDLCLVVYIGRRKRTIVFTWEELADDSQEGRERIKGKVILYAIEFMCSSN